MTTSAALIAWLMAGFRSPFAWALAAALPVVCVSLIAGRAAHWLLEREHSGAQRLGAALLLAALLTLAASGGTALAGLVGFAVASDARPTNAATKFWRGARPAASAPYQGCCIACTAPSQA